MLVKKENEQREVAELFDTKLQMLATTQEKEKEFKAACTNSYIKQRVLNVNDRIEQKAIDDLLEDIKKI